MNAHRFFVLELCSDIPCQSEIWILIYPLRYQAVNIGIIAKDMGERVREGWCSLDCRKSYLSCVAGFCDTEYPLYLVVGYLFLDLDDVCVHCSNVIQVAKDKSQLWIKSTSDYILRIFFSPLLISFERYLVNTFFFAMEIFFILCQLDHNWDLEDILKILCEYKRKKMPSMHNLA